ncbi:MAG: ferritin-like domain-containing protein [Aquabacterium sp.]|uniref:ferritin-like domain-containing protein n=1 Tax=Aquabacterium sp. TaxID=1872578 RepID=UPI0025BDE93A|nr:ferritin-like domain-containing protein [Aquabacterium sp.]MBI5925860.1 ferritin-like domain-containing protein [Aquabacterium sp.]
MRLRQEALQVLLICDPHTKAAATQALSAAYLQAHRDGGLDEADRNEALKLSAEQAATMPGRPARPALVSATQVPSRSPFTPEGRAALLHAICHIEFNAINLALDAVWRFACMPAAFYGDWLQVAAEEAEHFSLLRAHLQSMGANYGDFDAHDGLWTMCERTKDDILARMALVPRTLEARGLDATPLIQDKLTRAGDHEAVAILDIILRDEVGHVAIGNRWFHHLCQERGLDALSLYPKLVKQYDAPRMRPPFNEAARKAAGFTEDEMAFLLGVD